MPQYIKCAKCNKPVEYVQVSCNPASRHTLYYVRCHGKQGRLGVFDYELQNEPSDCVLTVFDTEEKSA